MSTNKNILDNIMLKNRFGEHTLSLRPTIVVIRNTNTSLEFVENNYENNCDLIMLVDDSGVELLQGRSTPHKKYLKQNAQGIAKCNYIASGYYPKAWRKGFHFYYRALRQYKSFEIWRSIDTEIENEDDYAERGIVGDNFHAHAPWSAGCVTVQGTPNGKGQNLSGDWQKADKWLYETHNNTTFFDAIILEHEDLFPKYDFCLRLGSQGNEVKALQTYLRIKADGDFGPVTFDSVREEQRRLNINNSGIVTNEQLKFFYEDLV